MEVEDRDKTGTGTVENKLNHLLQRAQQDKQDLGRNVVNRE